MYEPSPAERARTILAVHRTGALASLTSDFQPYVTSVAYLGDQGGNPVMVIANLEPHVRQAWLNAKAGMLIGDDVSILGTLEPVPGTQQIDLQPRYLEVHPDAERYVETLDFSWLRLVVSAVRWRSTWLDLEDWANAEPDPLAPDAPRLLADVESMIGDDLLILARSIGGRIPATAVVVRGVDRYGLDVDITEPAGTSPGRIPFGHRIDRPGEVLARLAFEARLAHDRAAAVSA